jgi:hypothetical protein
MDERASLILHLDDLAYADERVESKAPIELIEEADRAGVRRKILTRGEGGFHAHYSEFPPGYVVAPHSHDHDEMLIVVDGSATLSDGRAVGPRDTAVLEAGLRYGFTVGPDGLTFFNIRRNATTISMDAPAEGASA